MSQTDDSSQYSDDEGEDSYEYDDWADDDEDDFDDLDDPQVPHRALTEWGRRLETYAANWQRSSSRRVQVAFDLVALEPDAGVSVLLALMVDPDLHNDEDENPYDVDVVRHSFNMQAMRKLFNMGDAAARAAGWLVAQDPNGANLQLLVVQDEEGSDAWFAHCHPLGDPSAVTQVDLDALRHLVGASQLPDDLRRSAMGELIACSGAAGYAELKQLAADDSLSWIPRSMDEYRRSVYFGDECTPTALLIGQYLVEDVDQPIEFRIDVAQAMAEDHGETGTRALAAIYSSLPWRDTRRRDVLQRLTELETAAEVPNVWHS